MAALPSQHDSILFSYRLSWLKLTVFAAGELMTLADSTLYNHNFLVEKLCITACFELLHVPPE